MKVLICGIGAIGSNLTARLVSDLKGEYEITILDKDKVEERNVTAGTQFYTPDQIGLPKVEALQFNIYKWHQKEIGIINKEIIDEYSANIIEIPEVLTNKDNQTRFNPFDLVVDCFDNFESRSFLQKAYFENKIPLIHIGFSQDFTFAIEWAENYRTPSNLAPGFDICTMQGASAFVNSVSSLASLVVEEFINNNKKLEITGGKFIHSLIK